MPNFQQTVNIWSAFGVPGDFFFDGPERVDPWNLVSTPELNIIGRAFTVTLGGNPDPVPGSANAGTAQVGGTGSFAGILVNSKEYAAYATCSSGIALDPTLILPDNSIGQLMTMGRVCVTLDGAADIGDPIYYVNTTGALSVSSGGGKTEVPNSQIIRFDPSGSGLAVIQLTN